VVVTNCDYRRNHVLWLLFTIYSSWRLHGNVPRNRPENWKCCFLCRVKTTFHSALSMREFLAKRKVFVVPYPTFLSDLIPCHFFLFPEINGALKGRWSYNRIYRCIYVSQFWTLSFFLFFYLKQVSCKSLKQRNVNKIYKFVRTWQETHCLRYKSSRLMLSVGLWEWYINITITILDIIYRLVICLKQTFR
jgi:hypothetical protein